MYPSESSQATTERFQGQVKRTVEKANVKGEDISKVRGWMKMIRPTTRPLHHLRQVIVYCGPTALPPALDSFGCFPFCQFACDVDSYSEPVWFVLHKGCDCCRFVCSVP